jgi:beta-glucanase (GH16 family)
MQPAPGFEGSSSAYRVTRLMASWSIDGRIYHVATPGDLPGPWVFDHRFYLLINLAVGGDLGGPVGPETSFPQSLLVDYVRVYSP